MRGKDRKKITSKDEPREEKGGITVSVLVEEAEDLLELRDLLVRQMLRH